jgi:hypothetical protein
LRASSNPSTRQKASHNTVTIYQDDFGTVCYIGPMKTNMFRDRRNATERRNLRALATRIHCRRRGFDRRRRQCESDSLGWWLRTNYVDREMIVNKPRYNPK